jgi:hypothetical protein
LRCPFGCRKHHRRQRSSQRSAAYYRTPAGKRQKKLLNGRRSGHAASTAGRDAGNSEARDLDRPAPAGEFCTDALLVTMELRLQGAVLKESDLATSRMLPYLRMVMSLIEGVELTCREVVALLRQAMRQHSIGGRRRIDYLLGFLHQHPP